jgi:hypothetical protein
LTPRCRRRKLGKHVGPAAGAEIQQTSHVADQFGFERVPRIGGVQQPGRLLIPFGAGKRGSVRRSERIDAGDRQPEEKPIGNLRPKLQFGHAEATELPTEGLDGCPGTGKHLHALVAGQDPRQPGITHVWINRGCGGEHV